MKKQELVRALESGEWEGLEEKLLAFREECPEDLDSLDMLSAYYIYREEYASAGAYAEMAVRRSPLTSDGYYNLATVMEAQGRFGEAYALYCQSFLLSDYEKRKGKAIVFTGQQEEILSRLIEKISVSAAEDEKRKTVAVLKDGMETVFGMGADIFRVITPLVGKDFADGEELLHIARYNNWLAQIMPECDFRDAVREKIEMVRQGGRGTQCVYEGEEAALLPVCSVEPANRLTFHSEGGSVQVRQQFCEHFNYYRVEGRTELRAAGEVVVGTPVRLRRTPGAKRLTLSIFVDGLAQVFLDSGFEEYMPETYRFFSKGVLCKNAYSVSDWTYPSLASVITGLEVPRHMMIHSELITQLPGEYKLFSEYFRDAGYYTAKIDGDWRATPGYGYHRGFERILYQRQHMGMSADRMLTDAIDQIEMMRDTSQFVWISTGDLHDVADNLDLPAVVQAEMPLSCRAEETLGATSVKQPYSENKQRMYREAVRRVDRELGRLYRFLEEEYAEDEMVVGLFADHGQGFMVKEDEHFLSDGRSKVGMMFRGGFRPGSVCEDYINIADYMPIMATLSGVPFDEEGIDGKVPAFFGGKHPKDYVITETIHPGDPYYAVLHGKDGYFYFTSDAVMGNDGRIALDTYRTRLTDADGRPLSDSEQEERLCGRVLEHIRNNRIYGGE